MIGRHSILQQPIYVGNRVISRSANWTRLSLLQLEPKMLSCLSTGCFRKVETAPSLFQTRHVYRQLEIHLGDHVGSPADEDVLSKVGLASASAVIITFANPAVSIGILRSIRRLRADVPVLVRTQDDSRLTDLKAAGATEVVPETFEASLMLVSHVLMQLRVPPARVLRTVGEIRSNRYAALRSIFRRDDARPIDETHAFREELKSIVLPPGSWAVGRTLAEVRARGAEVAFTGIRRHGILGREPQDSTMLREGDIVVVYGQPEEIEHAEALLLAG